MPEMNRYSVKKVFRDTDLTGLPQRRGDTEALFVANSPRIFVENDHLAVAAKKLGLALLPPVVPRLLAHFVFGVPFSQQERREDCHGAISPGPGRARRT